MKTHTCIQVHTHTVYSQTHTDAGTHRHVCNQTCTCGHVHTHGLTDTRTHLETHACTDIHTQTHTEGCGGWGGVRRKQAGGEECLRVPSAQQV